MTRHDVNFSSLLRRSLVDTGPLDDEMALAGSEDLEGMLQKTVFQDKRFLKVSSLKVRQAWTLTSIELQGSVAPCRVRGRLLVTAIRRPFLSPTSSFLQHCDFNISILDHMEILSGHFDIAGSEGLDGMEADHIKLSCWFLEDKNNIYFVPVETR